MATASDKGTLIRIFKTDDGSFLQELRRGKKEAEIQSICFHINSKYIAASSDRGTVHVWSLGTSLKKLTEVPTDLDKSTLTNLKDEVETNEEVEVPKNQKSFLKFLPFKIFDSEWSFAQFRIDDSNSICTFGSNNTIIVISSKGKYYQASYETGKKGGECILMQETSLVTETENK